MDIHIVDDNELQLDLIKATAERCGLTAQGFLSAEEYLEYAALENYIPPKLTIITDIRMPGKSGYELMTEIRKNSPGQKFVVLTGTPNDKVGENDRACFYLAKPVRLDRFRKIFETMKKCTECGNQQDIFKCKTLNDLSDFNIGEWHCPHRDKN